MMEELLRKVLNNDELISLVGKDKSENPKIYLLKAPDNTSGPYVEYEVLNEIGSMYAENEEIATNYKIQIDVFTKGSYTAIVNLIKKIMKENGLMKEFGGSLYEDKTKLFHYILRFNYESEE